MLRPPSVYHASISSTNPEECKICLLTFNGRDKRPRVLPCGHTFCSCCLEGLLAKQRALLCPNCRAEHTASSVHSFPIVFALEEFVAKLSVGERANGSTAGVKQPPWKGLSKKFATMRSDQERAFQGVIESSEDTLSQLHCYKSCIHAWQVQHQDLARKLQDMIDLNAKSQRMLEEEERVLEELRNEGQQQQGHLSETAEALKKANTMQELIVVTDVTEECQALAENWVQRCKESFPNAETVRGSAVFRITVEKAMDAINLGLGTHRSPVAEADEITAAKAKAEPAAIGDGRAEASGEGPSAPEEVPVPAVPILTKVDLIMRNLLSLQTVNNLLESSEVFAVHEYEGRRRFARMSREDSRIYLHHLSDVPPPPSAHTIPYKDVAKYFDGPTAMAFLELAWAHSSARRRVVIRLKPNSQLGKRFLLNCRGDEKHSYAKSWLERGTSILMGRNCYCERGNDKQPKEEQVGRPIIGDAWGRSTECCPRFGFTIGNNDYHERHGIFGHVEVGLQVLLDAWKAMYDGVPDMVIADCGAATQI